MVNKAPKPQKAPKAKRRVPGVPKGAAIPNPVTPGEHFLSSFGEDSLFARSQAFVEANDAKPFRDFAYMILVVLSFFIWRLSAGVLSHHEGATSIWTFFTFSTIALLNIWTYFLVMICCRRGGDIGIVKIAEEDILRFNWMSGLFGAWAAIIYFKYKPQESGFYPKVIAGSFLNIFWVAIAVKYYLA